MTTMMKEIHGMKHGDSATFEGNGRRVRVSYYSRPSYGDDNRPVRGATTGMYDVDDANSNHGIATFHHGPQANTDAARRRGADPNAKSLTAQKAYEAAVGHLQGGFNDRRNQVDRAIGGPNGPLGRRSR